MSGDRPFRVAQCGRRYAFPQVTQKTERHKSRRMQSGMLQNYVSSRRSRRVQSGVLRNCVSMEQWMRTVKQKGRLSVPGKWWPGTAQKDRDTLFMCEITAVDFSNQKYTFTIECIDKDLDSHPYPMLWVDVERFWVANMQLRHYSAREVTGKRKVLIN